VGPRDATAPRFLGRAGRGAAVGALWGAEAVGRQLGAASHAGADKICMCGTGVAHGEGSMERQAAETREHRETDEVVGGGEGRLELIATCRGKNRRCQPG